MAGWRSILLIVLYNIYLYIIYSIYNLLDCANKLLLLPSVYIWKKRLVLFIRDFFLSTTWLLAEKFYNALQSVLALLQLLSLIDVPRKCGTTDVVYHNNWCAEEMWHNRYRLA